MAWSCFAAAMNVAPAPVPVSVIVPHYDDLARLDRCLDALARQDFPRDRYEIIVADNMTPAGREAVEAVIAGRARLVFQPERGAGPARNAGVAAAVGTMLAFTDADCLPEPGWLTAGIAALERFDFVGGAMTVAIEGDGAKSGAEAFELVFAFDNRRYVERKHFTVTANLFCPRALFDRVGPFKVGVSEDLEWCLRARGLGYRIGYAPAAVAAHPARRDWAALRKKWQRMSAESYALEREKPLGRLRWAARSAALIPSIIAHAPRALTSDALSGAGERAAALGTLARLRLWRFVEAQRLLFGGGD